MDQIELNKCPKDLEQLKISDSPLAKPNAPDSILIFQVKAIVDYVEIAIDSLAGSPNLILSQKLRYASKERLKAEGCVILLI